MIGITGFTRTIAKPPRHDLSRGGPLVSGTIVRLVAIAAAVLLWLVAAGSPALAASPTTVTACDESHLDAASANAHSGQTVSFACDGTITLTHTIVIATTLTLDGGGHAVTLSGGNAVQLLRVTSTGNLTVKNLTLTAGYAGTSGGAIESQGGLTVQSSSFTNNTAVYHGGAIEYDPAAGAHTYAVSNSSFSGNVSNGGGALTVENTSVASLQALQLFGDQFKSNGDGGATGDGGAVLTWGPLTAFGNSFSKNQCNDAGCALRGFAAISVSASQFTGNAGAGNGGGAIYSDGPLAVSTSQFTGNTAGNGGAIQANGQLSVTYSTFSGNSSSQSEGGAVFAYGALTVSNDLFNGNTSANYGGAVSFEGWRGEQASINNAVFTNNSTGSYGGAIYSGTGGTMTINNSTVGVQGAGNSSGLFGGGIENDGTMSINGSTIEYNTAVAGGGIMHQMGPSISFSGDTIEYNSADVNGGGGGIYTVGYDPLVTSVNTTWAYNTPDNCESPNYVTVPGCTG